MSEFAGKHILIIVENLPVPFDRRVWQEALALKEAGADVSVICPKMKGFTSSYEELEDIKIYRHSLPIEASGSIGYLGEYSWALFMEIFLASKIFIKNKFDVIHGCNPPDLIFLVALLFKPFGVKYVFDHHDVNPELYETKFGKKDFFYKLMRTFEKLTFRVADFSIATNESYKQVAIRRGNMSDDDVEIVRSGPDLKKFSLVDGNLKYKKDKDFLIGYVGVIGEQEGLDLLMDSVAYLKTIRNDFQVAIVGGGTELETIKSYASKLGLNDIVDFYGRVSNKDLIEILSSCDVCVNPDKPTPMNDISTMNKIMEYMALKKPIVQFDLKEGRHSARDASLYVRNGNTKEFAESIDLLLDDSVKRKSMGEYGYDRVVNDLSWNIQKKKLINHYSKHL